MGVDGNRRQFVLAGEGSNDGLIGCGVQDSLERADRIVDPRIPRIAGAEG